MRGTTMDELRQSDLKHEFPDWHFWVGVNRLPYARRLRRSPPVTLSGEDWTDLRDEVRAWLAARHY
jgi:hypothetical protein